MATTSRGAATKLSDLARPSREDDGFYISTSNPDEGAATMSQSRCSSTAANNSDGAGVHEQSSPLRRNDGATRGDGFGHWRLAGVSPHELVPPKTVLTLRERVSEAASFLQEADRSQSEASVKFDSGGVDRHDDVDDDDGDDPFAAASANAKREESVSQASASTQRVLSLLPSEVQRQRQDWMQPFDVMPRCHVASVLEGCFWNPHCLVAPQVTVQLLLDGDRPGREIDVTQLLATRIFVWRRESDGDDDAAAVGAVDWGDELGAPVAGFRICFNTDAIDEEAHDQIRFRVRVTLDAGLGDRRTVLTSAQIILRCPQDGDAAAKSATATPPPPSVTADSSTWAASSSAYKYWVRGVLRPEDRISAVRGSAGALFVDPGRSNSLLSVSSLRPSDICTRLLACSVAPKPDTTAAAAASGCGQSAPRARTATSCAVYPVFICDARDQDTHPEQTHSGDDASKGDRAAGAPSEEEVVEADDNEYFCRDPDEPLSKSELEAHAPLQGLLQGGDSGSDNDGEDPSKLLLSDADSSASARDTERIVAFSPTDGAYAGSRLCSREVLLVDPSRDAQLSQWVLDTADVHRCHDSLYQAKSLCTFVALVMGGFPCNEALAEAEMDQLRRTLLETQIDRMREQVDRVNRSATAAKQQEQQSAYAPLAGKIARLSAAPGAMANVVPLGRVKNGLCRHRALLLKFLADSHAVPMYMVRGEYRPGGAAGRESFAHVWCVCPLVSGCVLLDPTLAPFEARQWPDPRYLSQMHDVATATSVRSRGARSSSSATAAATAAADSSEISNECIFGISADIVRQQKDQVKRGGGGGGDDPDSRSSNAGDAGASLVSSLSSRVGGGADVGASCPAQIDVSDCKPVLREECGRGVSSVVHRMDLGPFSVAAKLPKSSQSIPALRREFGVLQRLQEQRCPGVPRVVGWHGGILMEYFPTSLLAFLNSLTSVSSGFSVEQRLAVARGVLQTLAFLHSNTYVMPASAMPAASKSKSAGTPSRNATESGDATAPAVATKDRYLHRDLKAENVMLIIRPCRACQQTFMHCSSCDVVPYLVDFADVVVIPGSGPDRVPPQPKVGTIPYTAPEILAEAPLSTAADMWSFGILLVEMRLMALPTKGECDGKEVPVSGASKIFVPDTTDADCPVLGEIAASCLRLDPTQRITAAAALAKMRRRARKSNE